MNRACRLLAVLFAFSPASQARVIDARAYHLGVAGEPEWEEFQDSTPHGPQLEFSFPATRNSREGTLLIRQRNVKTAWHATLNGQRIGTLETLTQPLMRALKVPAGLLRDGENRLAITRAPSRLSDDIVVGEFRLEEQAMPELLGAAGLEVTVTSEGVATPARITVVDGQGALVPLKSEGIERLAVRTGVAYTGTGRAVLGLQPGDYTVYASRGFEYSVATVRVTVPARGRQELTLALHREVPTPGLVASDTHIHTLTHSKHGDATMEERMLTIAGEGIELAVATDHNHHVDFTDTARDMGVSAHFRPVVGNEVSTKAGHFTAFPVRANGPVPNAQLMAWPELFANIRSVTSAQVIALNHPRDVHQNFTPLGPEHFDLQTGALRAGPKLDLDAIEVVTSAAMQSDVMQLFRDWFALLNYGYRVTGIAASDTHHVSEFILGQARSYVAAADGDPANINVDEICRSYREGRVLISLGLLTHMEVDGKFRVGDVALGDNELAVEVRVSGPTWVQADRVELFANGIKVGEQLILPAAGVEKATLRWQLPRPKHDIHLVAIATGPGITGPFWDIPRPYQPANKAFVARLLGATNPIWVDGDGDGKFTPARGYARRIVADSMGDAAKLVATLRGYDAAVATQVEDLRKLGAR